MPMSRRRRLRRRRDRQESPPSEPPARPHHKLWFAIKAVVALLIAVVGFVSGVYQIEGGPPWPTAPDVHPSQSGSSLDTPLEVRNRSGLFRMTAKLSCFVDLIFFTDADGKTALLRDMDFSEGGMLSLASGEQGALPCEPSRFVHVRENGAVLIGFPKGHSMDTGPGVFTPPIKILKLCLVASGTYRWFWRDEKFPPRMLQWPIAPGQPGWIEGPIANDNDQSKWIPPGSRLGAAWALREVTTMGSSGKTDALLPTALKCDVF
jgi:hypothetical protein